MKRFRSGRPKRVRRKYKARRTTGLRKRYGRRRIGRTITHHYRRASTGDFVQIVTGSSDVNVRCMSIRGDSVATPAGTPWRAGFRLAGIDNIVNPTDFTTLYDQYRINYVVMKFYLKRDPSAQAAAAAVVPRLYWYRDLDDSSAPADLNEMRENSRVTIKTLNMYRPVTIKVRPNSLANAYQSALANNYTPKWKQWVDMTQRATPHYIGKFAVDDMSNNDYRVDIETIVYFSCRQPR